MSNVSHGIIQGVIHGKTIVLAENPGIADGQAVEVVVRAVREIRKWGDGIRASAGALADLPEKDVHLEEIYRNRQASRVREIEE